MKKIYMFLALLPTIFLASCNRNLDRHDNTPDYYSFVTVASDGSTLRFVTDDGRTLVPTKGFTSLSDGQRLLIYFDLVNKDDKDKTDAEIRVFGFDRDVEVGTSAKVADADVLRALGDNGTSVVFYPNRPQVTKKYFNIYVGFNAAKPELHKFTLAFDESAANDSKVLELNLCHDDNGDSSSREWWTWLSFPVDEFADLYAGKEKVRINIKTRMSGIQSIELPVPQLDSEEVTALAAYRDGARSVRE